MSTEQHTVVKAVIKFSIRTLVPLFLVVPWIGMVSTPLFVEVIWRDSSVFQYDWVPIVLTYIVYFSGSNKIRECMNIMALVSVLAFVFSTVEAKIQDNECSFLCVGYVIEYFGLGCGYVEDACSFENFIHAFVIGFAIAITVIKVKSKLGRIG